MARDIVEVMEAVMGAIGDNDPDFLEELAKLHDTVTNWAAPEALVTYWEDFALIVNEYLPEPNKLLPWQRSVANIFSGAA